jgi:hypothetical protein
LKVEEDEEYSTDFGTTPKSYFDEAKSGSEKPNPVFVEREQFNFNYSGLEEEYSTDFGTNPKSYFDEAKSGSESPKSYFDEAKSGSESPNPVFVEREQLKFHYSGLEEEMPFPPKEYELQEYEWLRHGYTHKYDFAMPEESGSESPNPIFVEREQLEFNYSSGIEEMPLLPKEYEWLRHVY